MASEVAIVGAGLIGASIAWRLAQAGKQVTLFDAGKFGGETSSAGAGMLSPGGEFETPSVWRDMGIESMRQYPAFVDELEAETGLPIDFQICGCQNEGKFYADEGRVDPNDVLHALHAACTARCIKLAENRRISALESLEFSSVVIAAGAWSNQLEITHGGERVDLPPVKPIKGHLIGFDLKPGTLGPMVRRGHEYVLQRANGFTIAGSTEEDVGFDRTIDDTICRDIHERTAALWPPLKDATISKRWIGFRPYSETPHIGRVANTNVWLAYGHYRNGILLTPYTSQRIAAIVT